MNKHTLYFDEGQQDWRPIEESMPKGTFSSRLNKHKNSEGKCSDCIAYGGRCKIHPMKNSNITSELRNWFVNLVLAGKSVEDISKMPKSKLDALDKEYAKLVALIEDHTREARIEEIKNALNLVESGVDYQDIRSDLIDHLETINKDESK